MNNDILDLRTLADEWRDLLEEMGANVPNTEGMSYGEVEDATQAFLAEPEQVAELAKYIELCDELGVDDKTPDGLEWWGNHNEPGLIHEDYFEQYAEQLADDLGYLHMEGDVRDRWPFNHINWRAAAEELKADYTTVEYDGDTYYMRSC